ncbi:hypothetical protein D9O50_05840 [Oxalobacteraceae bacterium CAVE-383]|nr:hypothetical protein D9O50_05840 [Oxalobacteraceae bacterium CAVE-383]
MAYVKFLYQGQDLRHPVFKAAQYIFYAIGPALVGLTISMLTGRSGMVLTGIGLIFGLICCYLNHLRDMQKNFKQARLDFVRRGYSAEFSLPTRLFIDSKKRKFAFVDIRSKTYEVYDFEDILEWEHHWEDQVRSNENIIDGRIVNSKLVRAKNVLIFKVNDPHRPIHRIGVYRHDVAQTWMARISALLN